MLTEAFDIHNKGKDGTSKFDVLQSIFIEVGNNPFNSKSIPKTKSNYNYIANTISALGKNGYLDISDRKNITFTQKALDELNANATAINEPDDDFKGKAKKVDIDLLKVKKFKVPKVGKNSKYLEQIKTILGHMKAFRKGTVKTSYLLAGKPGVGKTSFIKSLSDLTGIPLVVIEAPHITQEHLINIPFLVIDGEKTKTGNVAVDGDTMKVVQAESNLVTTLKNKKKRTPEQIQKTINKSKVLREIQPQVQKRIDRVSDAYDSILFLDEFYRSNNNVKIQNVLRGILNGKLGGSDLPKGVYPIMASNIEDEGIDEIPMNHDFSVMDFDVSSKEDFANYLYGKYVDETINTEEFDEENIKTPTGIAIKPEVWNLFYDTLEDSDIGREDESTEVRFSPRRIEQFLLYINAGLPCDLDGARALMSFVRTNFNNYVTNETSDMQIKFQNMVKQMIKETSDISDDDLDRLTPFEKSEWKQQFDHEIKMKLELGDARSYVPVVSGAPGIGKTAQMVSTAENLNMGFISIDVSILEPEDVTGMPIANTSGDEITTKFSEPNLYISIMNEYNKIIDDFKQDKRHYNIILLFDELSRASTATFNSIRQVLLEKKFTEYTLPNDIMMVGALNPVDVGATEFTSHVRDTLDIITGSANFSEVMEYTKNRPVLMEINEYLGFSLSESVTRVMSTLAGDFKSVEDNEGNILDSQEQYFWWDLGGTMVYVSGREMTESISQACSQIEDNFDEMNWDIEEPYTEEEFELFIQEALNTTAQVFGSTLKMVALKQDLQSFSESIANKILGNSSIRKAFESIKYKKSANEISLVEIFNSADKDIQFLDKSVIGNYISYTSPTEFLRDVATIANEFHNEHDKKVTFTKSLDLYERLLRSLTTLDIDNQAIDMLRKFMSTFLTTILSSEDINLSDIFNDDKIARKAEKIYNL